MLQSILYLRRNVMATSDIDSGTELLIRIDERLMLLLDRMEKVEKALAQHQSISADNKIRLEKLSYDVYGDKNNHGLLYKVEQHDKLLTKAMAYFTIIAVIIEFCFKFYFHGMD